MVVGEFGNVVKYFVLGLESIVCKIIMLNLDLFKIVKKISYKRKG